MSIALEERRDAQPVDVRISDLFGHQQVELDRIDPSTPVADLLGISQSKMALPQSVEWVVRDNGTLRLLRRDQQVGDVAKKGKADLTLQPDARLG